MYLSFCLYVEKKKKGRSDGGVSLVLDGGALAPRIDSLGSLKLVCVCVSVCSSLIVNCLLLFFYFSSSALVTPACLAACSLRSVWDTEIGYFL